jgi:hypothetical protein
MAITTVDKGRRDPTLFDQHRNVDEILPEYFQSDNSTLITFLEEAAKFLDSDGGSYNFTKKIEDIYSARDISETSTENLDQIIGEIGNGLKVSTFFAQPRLMTRLLARFYQAKGTRNGAEGFFRGFFNEEVEIVYPKKDLFEVGVSNIGFDDDKRIIDNKIYQVLSILIKSGLSVADYEALYKKFVHPAGFHFAGQVQIIEEGQSLVTVQGLNPLDSGDTNPIYASSASVFTGTLFGEHTALYDSSDGTQFRVSFRQQELAYYTGDSDFTAQLMVDYYDDIKTLLSPNSFTFDDSANSGRPDFALTFETMDNDYFTRISSDSAI